MLPVGVLEEITLSIIRTLLEALQDHYRTLMNKEYQEDIMKTLIENYRKEQVCHMR